MKTILFQGDSITDSGRSREHYYSVGTGYSVLVRGKLALSHPGEYKVLNKGISGDRIVDLYARIKADILNLKPDILSILIGVNGVGHEFAYQNGVDAEKFYTIYDMLLTEVKEALPDIKIILLEPFVLCGPGTDRPWDAFFAEVQKRAEKVRILAEKHGLPFIPLQEKFTEGAEKQSPAYWIWDGLHPTNAGHELLAEEWLKVFETMIEKGEV